MGSRFAIRLLCRVQPLLDDVCLIFLLCSLHLPAVCCERVFVPYARVPRFFCACICIYACMRVIRLTFRAKRTILGSKSLVLRVWIPRRLEGHDASLPAQQVCQLERGMVWFLQPCSKCARRGSPKNNNSKEVVLTWVPKYILYNQSPCQICWLCLASKGNDDDMENAFTDVSDNAPFWDTYLQTLPWAASPPYADLIGFSVDQLMPDLLHVLNLGVARDLCGSILHVLIKGNHIFNGATIKERLQTATVSLKAFARSRALPLRMKKLTQKKLNWGSNKYAELRSGSGYDNYVCCLWLEEILTPHSAMFPDYCTMLWSLNQSMQILYGAPWFPSEEQRSQVKSLGTMFLRLYLKHAAQAVAASQFTFRVRPKFHLLHHVFWSRRRCNAAKYSTWMDEDFLRKNSKTLQLTNAANAQRRVLERWLLAMPESFRKSMAQ